MFRTNLEDGREAPSKASIFKFGNSDINVLQLKYAKNSCQETTIEIDQF